MCTTDSNTEFGSLPYYDWNDTPAATASFCNGRTWVQVISEWQGIPYDEGKNDSFFGHDSDELLDSLLGFTAPADVDTALFVVWVNNADLVVWLNDPNLSDYVEAEWQAVIDDAVDAHESAINSLYADGVRELVLPLAVDITRLPAFSGVTAKAFVKEQVGYYNSELQARFDALAASNPDLRLSVVDTFAFLEDVVANPAAYGVTNVVDNAIFALGAPPLDGPGNTYLFWDFWHPTALVQMHIADLIQQQISPPRIRHVEKTGGGFDLTLENVPVGRDGHISGSSNLVDWFNDQAVTSTSTTQVESVTSADSSRFFRADFPFSWTWP